jgi:hypothetical protein
MVGTQPMVTSCLRSISAVLVFAMSCRAEDRDSTSGGNLRPNESASRVEPDSTSNPPRLYISSSGSLDAPEGWLTRAQEIVNRDLQKLQVCTSDSDAGPSFRGQFSMRVGPDGRPSDVHTERVSDLTATCWLNVAKSWEFPPVGVEISSEFSLRFSRGGKRR